MAKRNGQKMRKNKKKFGPSACSRNEVFALPGDHRLTNCLLSLNEEQLRIVSEVKEAVGGSALLDFVPPECAARFEAALCTLSVKKLRMSNAWSIFSALLPLV
jgi:uncharacterized protein YjeT (DUF2065 family)